MKPLLEHVSDQLRQSLFERGHRRIFDEGSIIFERGESADVLPIVIRGAVKMIRMPEPGKEVIIGTFRDGEMFALPPVFDGGPYPSTAITTTETELLQITRDDFLVILRESSELAFLVIGWTCEMLREKTSMIRTLSTGSPEHRVGRILLKLFAESEEIPPVRITARRQDIAEMASLTTETTIRVIRRFADQGILRIEHGKVIIESPEPLQRLVRS